MRALRTSLAMISAFGLAPALASAQVTPEFLLTKYIPVYKGVDYDLPIAVVKAGDPEVKKAIEGCKVEENSKGWTLRDAQGRILRKFIDGNKLKTRREGEKEAGTHLDRWSYYQDGFEVYREVDADDDGNLDEVHWMNGAGTRVAKVRPVELKNGGKVSRIVAWTRISAEEASKVLVQAVIAPPTGDVALLETVLATPEELKELGLPEATIKRAADAATNRVEALAALRKGLVGWKGAVWSRFDGTLPHVIPADAAPGLKGEVLLYENAVIFGAPPEGSPPEAVARMAYLGATDVVKVGDSWKFLDLPHPVDPAKPIGGSLVSLRGDLMGTGGEEEKDPEHAASLKALAAFDSAGPPAADAGKKAVVEWHVARLKLLQNVIATAKEPADRLAFSKQAVGNMADAWKVSGSPDYAARLDKYIAQGGKIGSFAAHRKILTQFDIDADNPGNFLAIQKECLARFEKFLEQYGQSDEAPDALYQLASINEFNGEESVAKQWYARLAKDYPDLDVGKKAVGALRRLDVDGKPIKVAGKALSGKAASLDDYRGKPVVVVYFTTATEVDQKDLRDLAQLQKKTGKFEILGVGLDEDAKALQAFAREAALPWETIWEPGGMESRPANEMGIISTPTLILVDAQGKVLNRKLRKAAEVEKALDKPLAGRGVGLNLGAK